jgi:hypothetical protein
MPIDPQTGEELPYLVDPYEGIWPPDPSWDNIVPTPEESPVPESAQVNPIAEQAAAAADALFAEEPQVQLGMPRPVPDSVDPIDDSLITMGDGEPEAPPLTDEERAARLDEISAGADLGAEAPDVESPELLDPFGETLQQRTDAKSTEQIALEQFQSDQAAAEQQRADMLRAAQQQRQDAEDDEVIYRSSLERANREQAEIDAEATRLATEKIDPDGWRDSRSTFQTIAMYVAGIVGGLMQSKNGGRNLGLEMIDREIERHIQGQRENLANRRAMLGDRRAAVQDQRSQAEAQWKTEAAFRQAAYQRAFEEAEEKKQQFDQEGNTARQYTMFQRELQSRAAAAAQAHHDAFRKQAEHDLRLQMDVEKHLSQLAKDEAARMKSLGGGGGTAATKLKKPVSEWNAMFGTNVPDDGVPRTVAEFRTLGETGKSLTAPTEAEKEIRDLAIGDPRKQGEPLKNTDGAVYIPPSHAAPVLQKQMAAASQVVDILDEIDSIRSKVGGESKWGNSPEYQRVQALQNQLVILQKGGTEGMSSDEDMKKIAAAVGAADPASFRSQAAGLKQGRINTVNNLNASLRAYKYTGDPVTFPNKFKGAKQTPDQRELARIKSSTTGEKGQSVPTAVVASPLGATARVIESAVRDEDAGAKLPEDDKNQIDSWANDARAGNAEARANIANLAGKDTRSPAVRRYAEGILADLQAKELAKATGKKPGDKGFLGALRKAVGYTADAPEDDDEAEE